MKYSLMKKVNIALAAACLILAASVVYINYRANQEYIRYPKR
jgi:cell division protein FtsL